MKIRTDTNIIAHGGVFNTPISSSPSRHSSANPTIDITANKGTSAGARFSLPDLAGYESDRSAKIPLSACTVNADSKYPRSWVFCEGRASRMGKNEAEDYERGK